MIGWETKKLTANPVISNDHSMTPASMFNVPLKCTTIEIRNETIRAVTVPEWCLQITDERNGYVSNVTVGHLLKYKTHKHH